MKQIDRFWGHVAILFVAGCFIGSVVGISAFFFATTAQRFSLSDWQSISAVLRNYAFLAIGIPALWLAWRRTNTASKQAEISENGLRIDRYQKGASMLDSQNQTVRIAGIYALRELAITDAQDYYLQVLSLLYGHVREESKKREIETAGDALRAGRYFTQIPPELEEMLRACDHLRKDALRAGHVVLEADWRPSLPGSNLAGLSAEGFELSKAVLNGSRLDFARFFDATLRNCELRNTKIYGAEIGFSDCSGTSFRGAEIENCTFENARLFEANFSKSVLKVVDFSDAELVGSSFNRAQIDKLDFSFANMTNATMRALDVSTCKFFETNLSGTVFKSTDVAAAREFDSCWAWNDNPPIFDPDLAPPEIFIFDAGAAGRNRLAFEQNNLEREKASELKKSIPPKEFKLES